jgi:predicted RNA methylase
MKKGLKRDTIDKFYTNDETVKLCIQFVNQHLNIKKTDLIIEPSAGKGSFINGIKNLSNYYLFYDIEPEYNEIKKQNFLEFNPPFLEFNLPSLSISGDVVRKIHVIGNPPFGRNSSLAIQFIRKTSQFSDTISFILPRSFKKKSMKQKVDKRFHLIFETDIPNNAFTIDGEQCSVPCIFQIWEKKIYERTQEIDEKPNKFDFVLKNNNPNISFRRVGFNAGSINVDVENKNENTHYFIKFNNDKSVAQNIILLQNIYFDANNTVGPRSISKGELIKEFNKFII